MAGDYLPESESSVEDQQQSSAAARVTVEQFQEYPTLPSDVLDPEIEMTDQQPNAAYTAGVTRSEKAAKR